VQVNKVIRKRIRRTAGGINVVGDLNAAIAGNIGEGEGSSSHASVSSRQEIVQTSGRAARQQAQEETREREGTD
jgi:hypothetical protein